jgi:hypothetical protein
VSEFSAHPRTYGRYPYLSAGGRRRTRIVVIWESMKARCYYPKQKAFPRYGGRGITVCEEWREDFHAFRAWAIANGFRKDLTLDRIDNGGNYEPANCRWIPAGEQQWNTRRVIQLTHNGVTRPLPQWAAMLGVSPFLFRCRRSNGWTDEQILETPLGAARTGYVPKPRGRKPKSHARLEKRKGEIVKRVADMKDAIELIEQQIADHWAEIKKTEAP